MAEPCFLVTSSEKYLNRWNTHDAGWPLTRVLVTRATWLASYRARVSSPSCRLRKLSRWSDRIRRSQAPLFPGYVFVHVSDAERVPVLQTVGVVNLVSVSGKAARIQEDEIERLRACIARPNDVEPHPYLKLGHRVRVKHGPFVGCEGILVAQAERCPARNHRGSDYEVGRHQPQRSRCRRRSVSPANKITSS